MFNFNNIPCKIERKWLLLIENYLQKCTNSNKRFIVKKGKDN